MESLPIEIVKEEVGKFLTPMDQFCLSCTAKKYLCVRTTSRPYMHATVFSGNCYLCGVPMGITFVQKIARPGDSPDMFVLVCMNCHSEICPDITLEQKLLNMKSIYSNDLVKSDSYTDLTIGWNGTRKKKLAKRILDRGHSDAERVMQTTKWSGNFFRDIVRIVNTRKEGHIYGNDRTMSN